MPGIRDGRCVGDLSYEILQEIVSSSAEGLLVLDASGPEISIVYANPAYEILSGCNAAELEGTPWLMQLAADDDSSEIVELKRRVLCDEAVELSLPLLRKDGDIRPARVRLVPLRSGSAGDRIVLAQHLRQESPRGDNAELLKRALGSARRKLATLDRMDPVTGLLSRAQFELLLRRELAVSRREQRGLCLMLFQVPELDAYRQTFGDNAADSCLRMIGAQISGTFKRASDLCARIDRATLAVAVLGQDEEEALQLIAIVERKARSLGLHNPRGREGRYIFVRGVHVAAEPETDDVVSLTARGLARFEAPDAVTPQAAAGRG